MNKPLISPAPCDSHTPLIHAPMPPPAHWLARNRHPIGPDRDPAPRARAIELQDAFARLTNRAARFETTNVVERVESLPDRFPLHLSVQLRCNPDAPALTIDRDAFDWALICLLSHGSRPTGVTDLRIVARRGEVVIVLPAPRHSDGLSPDELCAIFEAACRILGARVEEQAGTGEVSLIWRNLEGEQIAAIHAQAEETI